MVVLERRSATRGSCPVTQGTEMGPHRQNFVRLVSTAMSTRRLLPNVGPVDGRPGSSASEKLGSSHSVVCAKHCDRPLPAHICRSLETPTTKGVYSIGSQSAAAKAGNHRAQVPHDKANVLRDGRHSALKPIPQMVHANLVQVALRSEQDLLRELVALA